LVDIAIELNLITEGVCKLPHPIREYRNLVYPGNELRNKIHFDDEQARIVIEVLYILYRDLTKQENVLLL
jgi:hypothetical protein